VSLPAATASAPGYMTATQAGNLDQLWAATSPRATETDWGFMDPADKTKRDALLMISAAASPFVVVSGTLALDPSVLVATSVTSPITFTGGVLGFDASALGSGIVTSVSAPLALDGSGVLSLPAATYSTDGYLTAADKTKLDGLAGIEAISAPLSLSTDGALGLQVAGPFGVTAGQLVLSVAAPLTVDSTSGTLKLDVFSSTLEFTAGLTPAVLLDPLWGLQVDSTPNFQLTYSGGPVLTVDTNGTASTACLRLTGYGVANPMEIANSGTTILSVDTSGRISVGTSSNPGGLNVGGIQVVGAQQPAIAGATDSTDVVTQINALLAALRAHGLIASN
jgi:hypothetical protein